MWASSGCWKCLPWEIGIPIISSVGGQSSTSVYVVMPTGSSASSAGLAAMGTGCSPRPLQASGGPEATGKACASGAAATAAEPACACPALAPAAIAAGAPISLSSS